MKKYLLSSLLVFFAVCTMLSAESGDYSRLSPADFMSMARYRMTLQDSFADLRGQVTHLRRNQGGAVYYPVRFVVRFGSQVQARITVNGTEVHQLQKNYRTNYKNVTCIGVPLERSILSQVGFKVEDLTMDFLDHPVKQELGTETVKTVKCRILLLESKTGELAKVWISQEYLFPLKAEFYAKNSDLKSKPARTLEITGFEKVDDYYVATEISLFSSQYRTRIAFGNCKVYKANSPQAKAEFGN